MMMAICGFCPKPVCSFRPATKMLKQLILPADLGVSFLRHRVIGLHQRIKEFMQVNRLFLMDALGEILPRHELLHREVARQTDDVGKIQRRQPFIVAADARPFFIQNLESLLGVGPRIVFYILHRQLIARRLLVGRVADQAGEGADQKCYIVAEVLKLPQLAHGDRMTQMQIGCARIITAIDPQRPPFSLAFAQTLAQIFRHVLAHRRIAVSGAGHQHFDLFFDCRHLAVLFSRSSLHRASIP